MIKKNRRKEDKDIPDQYRIEVIKTGDDYITREEYYFNKNVGVRNYDKKIEQAVCSIKGEEVEIIMGLIEIVENTRKEKEKLQETLNNYKQASDKLKEYIYDKEEK